jgi:hypothetical protein
VNAATAAPAGVNIKSWRDVANYVLIPVHGGRL